MGNASSSPSEIIVSRTSSTSLKGIPRVISSDSMAGRGRQLLETFDKARSDHATRYGGDDEAATVAFCGDVLKRGAPDWAERYTVMKTISCGTTSVVILATDEKAANQNQDHVAMKFARLGHDKNSPDFKERKRQFEIEAALQRRCDCNEIAHLNDFRIVDLFAIFIMEYLPRTLLDDIVASNRTGEFPELRAAHHVRRIAQALHTCHSLSIAHLDVKLDNILVSIDGEAKLCDFGLADLVPVNRSVATPLYSPPEIITTRKCTEKADMWSLGVCVFILLCGYPPFQPDDQHDLNDNICHARYSFRQDEGWAHVSALARDLVARLLVLDPNKRLSAQQVLEHPWLVAAAAMPIKPVVKFEEMTKPPLLKRHESAIVLEQLAERKTLEEKQKYKRSLTKFLEFAEEVKRGWEKSGWEGVKDVGKRDQNISQIFSFAEDVGRGWKEAGIQGAFRNAKSFSQVNDSTKEVDVREISVKKKSSSDITEETNDLVRDSSMSGTSASTSIFSNGTSSTTLSSLSSNEVSVPMTHNGRAERADSKLFLKAMYGSTSPLKPPTWVPDSEASVCRLCETPFTFFNRRHHCRACGQVVCNDCSRRRRIVERVDPLNVVRVCDLCSVSSKVYI